MEKFNNIEQYLDMNFSSDCTHKCCGYNDFFEQDLLQLNENEQDQQQQQEYYYQQQQQQQQHNKKQNNYDTKVCQLQNGIQCMKQMINQYQQQLQEIEELQKKEHSNQQNRNLIQQQQTINQPQEKQQEDQQQQLQNKTIRKSKKVFQCQRANCSYKSEKKLELTRHIRNTHQQKLKFQCRFCKQKFPIDQHRIQHEKSNHKIKIVQVHSLQEISEFRKNQDIQQKENQNDEVKQKIQQQKQQQKLEQQQQNILSYDQEISWDKTQENSLSHISKEDMFFINDEFNFSM